MQGQHLFVNEVGQAAADSDVNWLLKCGPAFRIIEKVLGRVEFPAFGRNNARADVLPCFLENPAKYKVRSKLHSNHAPFFFP